MDSSDFDLSGMVEEPIHNSILTKPGKSKNYDSMCTSRPLTSPKPSLVAVFRLQIGL
jgi:hypothetical protein